MQLFVRRLAMKCFVTLLWNRSFFWKTRNILIFTFMANNDICGACLLHEYTALSFWTYVEMSENPCRETVCQLYTIRILCCITGNMWCTEQKVPHGENVEDGTGSDVQYDRNRVEEKSIELQGGKIWNHKKSLCSVDCSTFSIACQCLLELSNDKGTGYCIRAIGSCWCLSPRQMERWGLKNEWKRCGIIHRGEGVRKKILKISERAILIEPRAFKDFFNSSRSRWEMLENFSVPNWPKVCKFHTCHNGKMWTLRRLSTSKSQNAQCSFRGLDRVDGQMSQKLLDHKAWLKAKQKFLSDPVMDV